MNDLFGSVFVAGDSAASTIAVSQFLTCLAAALVLGAFLAVVYSFRSRHTKSFVLTMFLLPAIVCVVIMMVNGNVGAGVAVAGTFSLVRFRSVPGSAKEIAAVFLTMGVGLVCGMGYIGYAALFSVVLGACWLAFTLTGVGGGGENERILSITIPEGLNYTDVFEEELGVYTSFYELLGVKTTNMGSLFMLSYRIVEKNQAQEKDFLDALRVKNGNLEISIARMEAENNGL